MSIVPIISPYRDPQQKIDIVVEKFDQTKVYADTAYDTAMDLITTLADTIKDIADVDTDIDFGDWTPDGPINIEEYLRNIPENPITSSDYAEIERLRPRTGIVYSETDYVSTLLDLLKTKLLAVINGAGSTLISSSLESQIFARETERDELVNQDAKDKIASDMAERGWELPGGGLFNAMAQVDTEYQNKRLDKSRAIAEETRKIEIENMWKALAAASQLEVALIGLKDKYWDRKLQAAKSIVETALAIYTGAIEALKGKAQAYGAEAGAYGDEMKAVAAIADVQAEITKAEVAYHTAKAEARASEIGSELKEVEIKANVAIESIKSAGSMAAQLCASALSAVAASAHISSGDSASVSSNINASESWTHKDEV